MPDLSAILDSIRECPQDAPRWLALADWLNDQGRVSEAVAVRAFWPTLRDNMIESGMTVETALADVTGHADLLADVARQVGGAKQED